MVKIDNIHNYFIIVLLFAITISTAATYIVFFFILIFWMIGGDYRKKLHVMVTDKLSITFLALFAIHLLGLLWTQNIDEGIKIASKQKIYLMAPLIISFFDKKYAKYAIWSFLCAMFVSEIYSLYLYLNFDIHTSASFPSPFMHHMHYSLILAFVFGYLVNEIDFKNLMNKKNLFCLFFAFLTIVVLFINKGRIGQVALIVVLFVLAVGKFRLSFIKSLAVVTISSIILFFSAYHMSEQFKQRVDNASYEFKEIVGTGKRSSIACRFEMWKYATQLGEKNILVGVGTGDSIREMTHLLGKEGFWKMFNDCGLGLKYQFNPHNNFLLFFMEFGLLGLLLFLWVVIYQFVIAFRVNSLAMVLLLSVTITGMMTTSLISMHLKYMFFYAFMTTVLYFDALDKNKRASKNS